VTTLTRRAFLGGVAAIAAAPVITRTQPRRPRLPISFSTLGCPKWPWRRILDEADRLGYAAIELRGIEMQMDLPRLPEFTGTRLAESVKELDARGLQLSDLGASARMHEADQVKRAAQLDEGRRFIDLAHQLRCPYVRVFGDRIPEGEQKRVTVARVIEGLRALGEHARGSGVGVLLESHGDFTDSPTLLELMKGAAMDNVALVWDAHHTFVAGKEQPATTYETIAPYVRHTHLKDSRPAAGAERPEGDGIRYVLTGEGTVPVRDAVRVLARGGYKGYYGFEWEKGWHPEIPDPEVAFPHYVDVIRKYLADAGVTV
jgi:sugar phosphate isomerase/epimerase